MRLWSVVLVVGALALSGCSDDDTNTPTPDNGVADSGGHDGAGDVGANKDGAVSGTLSVKVMVIERYKWWNHYATKGKPAALAGATVAVDLPGGKRVEATSASDGGATFKDVDWSQGTAGVTAYKKDHVMRSHLGITKADGEVLVYLHKYIAAPDTVKISGALNNSDSAATNIVVGPSTYGTNANVTGATYDSTVEKGKAFDLYAFQGKFTNNRDRTYTFEWKGAAKVSHAGSTSDITQDIDFTADKVSSTKVTGTLQVPAGKGMAAIGSQLKWWVRQRHNAASLGWLTKTTLNSSGNFAFEGQTITPKDITGVQTHYYLYVGADNIGSYRIVPGFPKEGATVSGFMEMATVTSPASGKTLSPGQTITFTNPEAKAEARIGLFHATNGTYGWMLYAAPGTTSFKLPALPTGVTYKELLGTDDAVDVRLALVGEREKDTDYEVTYSYAAKFKIQLAHPKTVTITGALRDQDTVKNVDGVKVCLKDNTSVPCVTSVAANTPGFSLFGVPNDKDVEITTSKSGYINKVLPRPMHGWTTIAHTMISTASLTPLASKMGLTLDKTKGLLIVSIFSKGKTAPAPGATVTLNSGDGPFYADATGYPDKSLKAVDKLAWVWFANVPLGAVTITAKDKDGKVCKVYSGTAGVSADKLKINSYADTLTSVTYDCP